MFKNKYVIIGSSSGAVLLIAVACVWVIRSHRAGQLSQSLTSFSSSQSVSPPAAPAPVQTTTAANDSSSLGVKPTPGANNLGQLSAPQPVANSAQSGSTGPQEPDPTKFGQYDKYKSDSNALFGDIQVGQGAELKASMKAAVYYKGWLTNGTLFDASRAGSDGKLQPFIFTLGAHAVIAGWEQGLTGMKVGGTRLLIVPPLAGYGASGQGSIPANATLVFEVQLVAAQ